MGADRRIGDEPLHETTDAGDCPANGARSDSQFPHLVGCRSEATTSFMAGDALIERGSWVCAHFVILAIIAHLGRDYVNLMWR